MAENEWSIKTIGTPGDVKRILNQKRIDIEKFKNYTTNNDIKELQNLLNRKLVYPDGSAQFKHDGPAPFDRFLKSNGVFDSRTKKYLKVLAEETHSKEDINGIINQIKKNIKYRTRIDKIMDQWNNEELQLGPEK